MLLDFTDSDANGAALPALARRYLHGPAVDQVLAQENVGGETYWLLGDHMNSTHDVVRWDAAAGLTTIDTEHGHQVYDAFGTPVDTAYLTRYQFTGREYDSATGQQYNRARWYSPHAGRWMSEDPIGFAAGDANLVRYVGNQPTNRVDPSGRTEWRLDLSDHGAPHIQLGDSRWDAVTFRPVTHKGKTPLPLTEKQLEELRQCNVWDRMLKNLTGDQRTNLETVLRERLTEEAYEEMRKRGTKSLRKTVAREIAEVVLRRTPLMVFVVLWSADDAMADFERRGLTYATCNQMVPIDLIESISNAADERFHAWLSHNRFELWKHRFLRSGMSEAEAEEEAWNQMPGAPTTR